MISAEQFAEWKEHPVTKEIFKEVKQARDNLKEKLANGDTICYDADATHGTTSKVVGQISGLDQLLNISYATTEDVNDYVIDQSGY